VLIHRQNSLVNGIICEFLNASSLLQALFFGTAFWQMGLRRETRTDILTVMVTLLSCAPLSDLIILQCRLGRCLVLPSIRNYPVVRWRGNPVQWRFCAYAALRTSPHLLQQRRLTSLS